MSGSHTMRPSEAFGWAWTDATFRSASALRVPVRSLGRTLRAGLGLAGLGGVALFGGFLAFVACVERDERPLDGRADGIVALTGGAQRIGDAIDLLANGYGRRLLITGVNERTSRDEIARLNPTQRHWIDCCVDLDYRARNTIGNAIETRRWMRLHRFSTVAVVTSNYHMPRTLVELDHALPGIERVVPYPVVAEGFDAGRWWQHPSAARLLASEYLKFLVAWVRTRFEDDPERSRAAILVGRGKPIKMVAEPLLLRGQR
ncbi:YdcF family protein [Methylobacterium sp. Leaf99]|uniref:YdcF family protein n=1 Tax=Methylobacterium sp. Leaf99 TaxID=1736251 RepID=UPI0009EB619B|nr:YdcF family protein [Methylobacterium sp. Leaf99]